MAAFYFLDSILILVAVMVINEVLGMSNDGSLSMISNNDHMIWKVFNIRNIRSTDTKTDTNVTTGGTPCYNQSWAATNGTFYCPQPGEPLDWTSCCGVTSKQYCCAPKVPEKKHNATIDIITALSIVIGFIVVISFCLLLYCCCCQKRSGVHSGKLVWLKRKKSGNKTVYTTSDNPDIDEDQEGTELVGFIEQREENGVGSRRASAIESIKELESRRGSKASLDHHKHHHNHHKTEVDGDTNHSPVQVVKHVTPSGQVLMVPLINIQGSTPGTSPS